MADPRNPDPEGKREHRLLGLIGIDLQTRSGFHLRFRKRFLYFLLFLVFLGLASLGGLTYYSTQPSFCNSCHIMEPYYNAWKTSSHNFVSCVECHYPPGKPGEIIWHKFQALSQVVKYVTRTYSPKPYAEVENRACLREGCHSTRLLQGKVLSEKGIKFDHKPHLEQLRLGRQLRCVSCHSQIVVGKHMEVTWDTCYLCHLKGRFGERGTLEPIGGCRGCHTVPEEDIKIGNLTYNHLDFLRGKDVKCQACHRDTLKGEGRVSQDRCFICHNQPEKISRFGETDFLHQNHVTKHNTACFHCHQELRHGLTIKGEPEKVISECGKCHSSIHDLEGTLYVGKGAKGVPEIPSPMFLARVDCTGCHLEKEMPRSKASHALTYTGSELGCSNCHGPEYMELVMAGQNEVEKTRTILARNLEAVKAALGRDGIKEKLRSKIQEKLDEAGFNLELLRVVNSAHNIYYAAAMLAYADKVVSAAGKILKAELEPTSDLPFISGTYCADLCHSRIEVKAIPETITVEAKTIPHEKHIKEGLKCNVCHQFGLHKDSGFKGKQACLKCHSEDQLK